MLSGLDGFVIENDAQRVGLGGHISHSLPTIAQQRDQRRSVAGHGFHVEGHFLLGQPGLLKALDV
ncbi:hypothetical protein D9M71_364380 [compost metagenome]